MLSPTSTTADCRNRFSDIMSSRSCFTVTRARDVPVTAADDDDADDDDDDDDGTSSSTMS